MNINLSSPAVITVGIPMPSDFPTQAYESISHHCQRPAPPNPDASWVQFRLAWHSVVYRFAAMAEHDEGYRKAFPPTSFINLYNQEKELFGFFVTGLSTLESYAYGTHFLLAIVHPELFPVNNLRKIEPKFTQERLEKYLGSEPLAKTFRRLVTGPQFRKWEAVRNALAHRGAPRRKVTLGKPGSDIWEVKKNDIEDKFYMRLTRNLTTVHRRWLSKTLSKLLKETLSFVEKNISKAHI
jgi:hypothetical protein